MLHLFSKYSITLAVCAVLLQLELKLICAGIKKHMYGTVSCGKSAWGECRVGRV